MLFGAYEAALTRAGFLAMGGQIVDASIIAAPKQRNTDAEKRDIKEGRIPAGWADKPAKLAQKDRDARWTVKWSKAKPAEDGKFAHQPLGRGPASSPIRRQCLAKRPDRVRIRHRIGQPEPEIGRAHV